jgi:hypothetical protein
VVSETKAGQHVVWIMTGYFGVPDAGTGVLGSLHFGGFAFFVPLCPIYPIRMLSNVIAFCPSAHKALFT